MKTTLDYTLDLLLKLMQTDEDYWELNKQIQKVQGSDFSTHLHPVDEKVLNLTLELVDSVLEEHTGFEDLGSYFLYDAGGIYGYITDGEPSNPNTNVYEWDSTKKFVEQVNLMCKNNLTKP